MLIGGGVWSPRPTHIWEAGARSAIGRADVGIGPYEKDEIIAKGGVPSRRRTADAEVSPVLPGQHKR